MWQCRQCGSNNERKTCWRCRAPRPDEIGEQSAPGPTAIPPAIEPAPGWAPSFPTPWSSATGGPSAPPPPRRRLSMWIVVGCAVGMAAVGLVGTVGVGRAISHLMTPARALQTPASINGLPRVGDASPATTASFAGQSLVDIASGVYGSGDVRYVLVAISAGAVLGDRTAIVDAMAPQVGGDEAVDPTSKTTMDRLGVAFTCWRTTGAVAGAVCSWNADGVTGVVTQLGSADLGRAADFAAGARGALAAG